MSIKARLEAKKVRRAVVPVQLSDPDADLQILQGAMSALATAQRDGLEDQVQALLKQVDQAQAAVESHFANVELQALPKDEWNAAATEYDNEGSIDWPRALPVLLAESCVDPELRDEEWWAKQFDKPEWSNGDFASLQVAVYQLNVRALATQPPKD